MKRSHTREHSFKKKKNIKLTEQTEHIITPNFLKQCEQDFKQDDANIIARNAVNSVGSMLATINSDRTNEISYVFLNSVKRANLRATNQGASGRCWMFAALNTFRHILINAFQLQNFEFSETYLFFWDKLERSNWYLQWFLDNPQYSPGDRSFDYMVDQYMSDGGWWNSFANLVAKYGLVPKEAMNETFQSDDSDDMNRIIKEQLDSCVNFFCQNRQKARSVLEQHQKDTVQAVYNTLTKFLGHPPRTFGWTFTNIDHESNQILNMTPMAFMDMITPGIDIRNDFVSLAHIPDTGLSYYQKYSIKCTKNTIEGDGCELFNVPIDEMVKYATKSIDHKIAVWFVGDVKQSFNWFRSALDDQLDDHKTVFKPLHKFDKGSRIMMKNVQGCHAMALTGYNLNAKGQVVSWQVENSWGYFDHETPGQDGFLFMSHSWFEQYVTQLVVMKRLLSRNMKKKLNASVSVELEPWDGMAPAVKATVVNPPAGYMKTLLSSRK